MATLPTVVLRDIATKLIDRLKDDALRKKTTSTLCSLRLTCRELGKMAAIKDALFSNINLHATQTSMTKVERTDFSAIGPSIRRINFFTSPYFYDLDIMDFKKMLYLHYAQLTEVKVCGRCISAWFLKYVEEKFSYPRSDNEHAILYQSYMERAHNDQHSAVNGSLARAWATMLRFSEHVDTIKLCPASKATSHMPYQIVEIDSGQCDHCSWTAAFIGNLAEGSGDHLLTAVFDALASTVLPIKNLTIECRLKDDPTADWRALHWEPLALDQVETVVIKEPPYGVRDHSTEVTQERTGMLFY
ncbi:hypothetical protein PV11_04540 [Exophiala sideris]|uniref:Uncharacterized protein n=1 Tax=Exophiala sideris TaxID=1016849 RepID=A0A0D1W118_9EURO|nr:hypothetical protein PV11_04540 [Exophiala sideris]